MKRYPHYWWPSKSHRYPSRMAVLDCDLSVCDTSPSHPIGPDTRVPWTLLVADFRGGVGVFRHQRTGDSLTDLWSAIATLVCSRWKVWLWTVPSGAILNAIGFFDRLERREVVLSGKDWSSPPIGAKGGEDKRDALCVIEDPPTLILCELPPRPGRLLILDVRNIGINQIEGESNCGKRAARYMDGICACMRTLRDHGQGGIRCTAGSQAVSTLRTAYPVRNLHCHTHADTLALDRASLYGGRCECFRIGDIPCPVYHLDVRNMYPALCRTLPLPVSLRSYHDGGISAERCARDSPASAVGHVRIRTDDASYPCRRGGIIVYPIGEYDTVLAGPELLRAVQSGAVRHVYEAAEYTLSTALADFYTHWLSQLADARRSGDAMLQQWIKRVMVSLIGKFAEPGRRWVASPPVTEMGPFARWSAVNDDGEQVNYRNVAWYTQREERYGESYWSIPSVASWITSAARVQLNAYLSCVRSGQCYYLDTDAIFCSQIGYQNLLNCGHVRESEAGYLRLLGSYSRCHIYGLRHYAADGNITCSGPPKGEIQEGETRLDYAARVRSGAITPLDRARGHGGEGPRISRPEPYRHGVVGPDGIVTPFRIQDE